MINTDAIRLNITVHPEKDPELFCYFMSIENIQARSRRLLNLAAKGLLMNQFEAQRITKATADDFKKKSKGKKRITNEFSKA